MEFYLREKYMSDLKSNKNQNGGLTYRAGAVIYVPGKVAKKLYILKSGEVRLLRFNNQHLQVVQVCKASEILNEVSILLNLPIDHCAIAKTDVELVSIDSNDIQQVIKMCPTWVPDIFKTLCERLVDSQEIINEHNLITLDNLNPNLVLSKEDEKKYLEAIAEFNSN